MCFNHNLHWIVYMYVHTIHVSIPVENFECVLKLLKLISKLIIWTDLFINIQGEPHQMTLDIDDIEQISKRKGCN